MPVYWKYMTAATSSGVQGPQGAGQEWSRPAMWPSSWRMMVRQSRTVSRPSSARALGLLLSRMSTSRASSLLVRPRTQPRSQGRWTQEMAFSPSGPASRMEAVRSVMPA